MLLPANFPATKPLVAARFTTIFEHNVDAGDKVAVRPLGEETNSADLDDKGVLHIDYDLGMRLWLVLYLVEDKDFTPTPAETPAQEAERVVKLEPVGGGWFLITAPWLAEGVKVQGEEAAQTERDRIAAKGDTKGVTVEQNGSWYTISAPWLDEPIKVQGAESAAVEEHMLIEDGPPEGWVYESPEAKAERLRAEADAKEAQERAEADRIAAEKAEQEEADRVALERAQAEGEFQMTATGGGWYSITGPGLQEPARVRGEEAANTKLTELRAAGQAATEQASTTDANGANQANPVDDGSQPANSDNSGAATAEVTGAEDQQSAAPVATAGDLGTATGSEAGEAKGDDSAAKAGDGAEG